MGVSRDITERKRAERNLRRAKEFSEQLIDTANTIILTLDNIANLTSFNTFAEELTGYKREEVLGKNWFETFIPHRDQTEIPQVFKDVLKKMPTASSYENPILCKDGSERLISWNNTVIKSDTDETIGVLSIGNDITEHKRAEELKNSIYRISEAAQSDQKLEELYRSIHTIVGEMIHAKNFYIALYDPDSELLNFPYFIDEYDENPGDIKVGKGLTNYVLRTGRSLLASSEVYEELVKNGEVESIGAQSIDWLGVPLKTDDKTIGVIAVQSYTEEIRFGEEEKNILTFVSEQIAMTIERKRTEEEIKSLARFPAENPSPILRIDLNGILLYANKPALSMRSDWDFQIGQIVPDKMQKLIKMTKYDVPWSEDLPCGDLIYSITSSLSPDTEYYDVFANNITDRKEAEEEREIALQEAQNANKVKDLFLANMSHEIRTPLNTILGFSDLIHESTRDVIGEEESKFFNVITSSGERLMQTVHEILDISQIDSGTYSMKIENYNLVPVVQELVDGMQIMAKEKQLKLEFHSTRKHTPIRADRDGISQSITNIIDNAIKYTERGQVTVELRQKYKGAILTIQDTGIGMSKEYLYKLYEAFTQESEGYTKEYQGIGLGMAIAKRHLDLNLVDIAVDSTKGIGTTFTLTFPDPNKINKQNTEKKKSNKEKGSSNDRK